MKKTTLFIICLSFFGKLLLSQNWYERYYQTRNGATSVTAQLKISDSDFLIAGTSLEGTNAFPLLTLNRFKGENDPSSVWYKKYNLGYNAEPTKILKLSDGNYLITGTLSPSNSYSKIFALKINSSGAILWSKTYSFKYGEVLVDALVDGNNICMIGTTVLDPATGKTDIYFLNISSSGEILYKKSYGIYSLDEIPTCITKGNSGEYLVGGTQNNKSILLRINNSGNLIIVKKYTISTWADDIKAIKYIDADNIYLIGNITHPHNIYGETFIIKVNNTGTILTKKAYRMGMHIGNVAFNGDYTAIVGKADVDAGQKGFKLVVFDYKFNIFGSNHFQELNNNGAMQTLVSVKKSDRYYMTVKTPEIEGSKIYHILANENGYGCSSTTFNTSKYTINPTVSTLTFPTVSNGSSNNLSVTFSNNTYPLTFSCEVIVDIHKLTNTETGNSTFQLETETTKTIVYPTNTSGEVFIKSVVTNYAIKVYDVYGKLVMSQANNSSDTQINLDEVINGLYFLNIEKANGERETFKIIKSN